MSLFLILTGQAISRRDALLTFKLPVFKLVQDKSITLAFIAGSHMLIGPFINLIFFPIFCYE